MDLDDSLKLLAFMGWAALQLGGGGYMCAGGECIYARGEYILTRGEYIQWWIMHLI